MQIRYRNRKGQFVSASKAKRLKTVKTELVDKVWVRTWAGYRNVTKSIGIVQGFVTSQKKLSRMLLPKVKLRKPAYRPPDLDEELDAFEELGDVEQWEADYQTDFPELDALDDLTDLLEDEEEWYHTAS